MKDMSLTLKEFIKTAEQLRKTTNKSCSVNLADALLGKYENLLPNGVNSTEYIRELRGSGYGKIKSTNR
jgi:hypothetical protein